MAAAKSLINYFRDVCPQMLPKKYVGRFTEMNVEDAPVYGSRKIATTIEGLEYLKEGNDVLTQRVLTDKDLKKMRVMKLREAVRKVDRHGFRSSSESEMEDGDEEGEAEQISQGEEGEFEQEMSEGAESEQEEKQEDQLEIAKQKAL